MKKNINNKLSGEKNSNYKNGESKLKIKCKTCGKEIKYKKGQLGYCKACMYKSTEYKNLLVISQNKKDENGKNISGGIRHGAGYGKPDYPGTYYCENCSSSYVCNGSGSYSGSCWPFDYTFGAQVQCYQCGGLNAFCEEEYEDGYYDYDRRLHFEYVVSSERDALEVGIDTNNTGSVISDYSNVPYDIIPFVNINSTGKQWIYQYFLALCKEVLGTIRQKYQTIPVPGAEVTLDGAELRQEASAEKEKLITQLRENLEASTRKNQLEMQADESEMLQNALKKVPLLIYTG